jgi:hypothetical protein
MCFVPLVSLDGNCTKNEECDQSDGLICRDEKCKCDVPWYQPCNKRCGSLSHH